MKHRRLIVNADDFGLAAGVNAGIVEAHERGIVTSTSLMVCQPAAREAATYARGHPRLGVGLHVDLWESELVDWQWVRLYERCAGDEAAVEAEVLRQLDAFRDLVGREPDHLDTHQHVHRLEPVRTVMLRLAQRLGLPLRGHGEVAVVGGFYGQTGFGAPYPEGVSIERLLELLDTLPPGPSELTCHPGRVAADDTLGGTMYRQERNAELLALCHPRALERMARGDIVPATFADLRRAVAEPT
jgi:predicted glycoside hydrolase/deacetylase ChbG (UPF0249 family)